MRKQLFITLCFTVLSPAWVQADDSLSWSYLDASYIDLDTDVNGIDAEPDGYKLKLSLNVIGNLFLQASRTESDGRNYDFDSEGYGFGFHGDFFYASYTYNTWDFGSIETDVDTLRFGLRSQLTDRFEFNASYSWNDIEDFENEDGFQVGLVFQVVDFLDLFAEYETIGGDYDFDQLSVGVRINF